MSGKIPVAVLGATGTVGQKFVRLLADHPWFEVTAVAASAASAGKPYGEAARWRESTPIPDRVARMTVVESAPPLDTPIVFSALDAQVAEPIEQAFALHQLCHAHNLQEFGMVVDPAGLHPSVRKPAQAK